MQSEITSFEFGCDEIQSGGPPVVKNPSGEKCFVAAAAFWRTDPFAAFAGNENTPPVG